ncbi:hypothetical protein ACJQWK_00480 [Exserohilum turcicum]
MPKEDSRPVSSTSSKGSIWTQMDEDMSEKDSGMAMPRRHTFSISLSSQRPPPPRRLAMLCLHWFTTYRILIALTFIANMAVLAVLVNRNRPFTLAEPLIATAVNLFVAVLVRQEDIINLSFSLVAKTPIWLPLWFRTTMADFHHYGGIHVGSAMAALLWYIFFVHVNTIFFLDSLNAHTARVWMWVDIATCYSFLVSIVLVCITAHPKLRMRFHNTFEHTHRFGGWIAMMVLWANTGVSSITQHTKPLYLNPAVWLLAATTMLIIMPWTRIRRVLITASLLSSREVRISFPYKNMPYSRTMRFSHSPLLEWHAFATIPTPDHASAFVLVSQAGDWTKALIQNPPSHIWLRRPPAANFLCVAPLFKSLLLVATGAGIGPMISLLSSPIIAKMKARGTIIRVLWCVYDPEAPHWQFVLAAIRAVDPNPYIYDSSDGRPDIAGETGWVMREKGIEAAMVVSNPKVTREVVEGVKGWGGAAFGAVVKRRMWWLRDV